MISISGVPMQWLTRLRALGRQNPVAPVPPVNPVERHLAHAHGFRAGPAARVSISAEGRVLAQRSRRRRAEAEED